MRTLASLAAGLCLTCPLLLAQSDPAAGQIELREWRVLSPVGQYGRQLLHADPIEALVIRGEFTPPTDGDRIPDRGGRPQAWSEQSSGEDGWLKTRQLNGGYAWTSVTLDSPGVYVLRALGHSLVYVNGEIRGGDPYSAGTLSVPVELHAGENTFLFQVGRGQLRATLTRADTAADFNTADLTLPDLIAGKGGEYFAGVPILNQTARSLSLEVVARLEGGAEIVNSLPPLAPLTVFKAPLRFDAPALGAAVESVPLQLTLRDVATGTECARQSIDLEVRAPSDRHNRTFISEIDGSCQYFAVTPAHPAEDPTARPALFLTLHGASVEARGQAAAYGFKDWGHVVAPTNRRPYGFDWEDWGRLDAIEVLDIAMRDLDVDPQRVYLTGHSMGGHGTWQVGLTFPDRFAAIAPSAGWVSFWSYTGASRYEADTPIETALRLATSSSDTLALVENARAFGVYVLHGEADDNVPVSQARTMRTELAKFHGDFAYYERPGAGHWWGNKCVDWPPLFQFLADHTLAPSPEIRQNQFSTAGPGVSPRCHWLIVHSQEVQHLHSKVDFAWDPAKRELRGTTENVAVLGIDTDRLGLTAEQDALVELEINIDGQPLSGVTPSRAGDVIWLARADEAWSVLPAPPSDREKSPQRAGLFKSAFTNRFVCVYGTQGSEEENAALLSRARYDADTFAYRGNGCVRLVPDSAFDAAAAPDDNVVLYGNAENNSAWSALLGDSPLQVSRSGVGLGTQRWDGDSLGGVAIRPRPGSARASVGVVFGTGGAGLRLTERLPYFLSGVGFPDYLIVEPEILEGKIGGVAAAGFFGLDWRFSEEAPEHPAAP